MSRPSCRRPPFENRWTSGERGWRWYRELEALGVEDARVRLALQDSATPCGFPDPEIPAGFVRDWLRYRARCERRGTARWRTTMLLLATAAALGAGLSAVPVLLQALQA